MTEPATSATIGVVQRFRVLVSPWLIGGLAVWIGLMAGATAWSIPIFANVATPGLNCTPEPCATVVTTEWLPSLIMGAVIGSVLTGAFLGAAGLLQARRRGSLPPI